MRRKTFFYKGIRVNSFGIPQSSSPKDGKNKSQKVKRLYNTSFNSPFKKGAPKNLIVMYDIPSNMKKERDWFRRQLIKFDYEMVQRSVWVGPSPLPRSFLDYLREIGIENKFKTFKLAKPYNPAIYAMA